MTSSVTCVIASHVITGNNIIEKHVINLQLVYGSIADPNANQRTKYPDRVRIPITKIFTTVHILPRNFPVINGRSALIATFGGVIRSPLVLDRFGGGPHRTFVRAPPMLPVNS